MSDIAFNVDIKEAQANFFDRERVQNAIGIANAKYLERGGGMVRLTARRSIRNARQMTLGEMTAEMRSRYHIAEYYAKKEGRKKPRRPNASSAPGEPPRNQTGLLKNWILNSYDAQTETAVIGPAKLNRSSGAPETLEFGGVADTPYGGLQNIAPRPFMGPALEKIAPKLPALWRNLIKF